jgi:hypothetical protein
MHEWKVKIFGLGIPFDFSFIFWPLLVETTGRHLWIQQAFGTSLHLAIHSSHVWSSESSIKPGQVAELGQQSLGWASLLWACGVTRHELSWASPSPTPHTSSKKPASVPLPQLVTLQLTLGSGCTISVHPSKSIGGLLTFLPSLEGSPVLPVTGLGREFPGCPQH